MCVYIYIHTYRNGACYGVFFLRMFYEAWILWGLRGGGGIVYFWGVLYTPISDMVLHCAFELFDMILYGS